MKTLIIVLLLTEELNCFKLISRELDPVEWNKLSLTYPGTNWCGAGNNADNYDDLNTEEETDKCCRTHDQCDDTIRAFGTKHNLINLAPYTRGNCRCDEDLHQCLKTVNTKSSRAVGNIFFNLLRNKCFREDYPVIGCIRYNLLLGKCLEYRYDTTKPKTYQWFDVPPF